MLGDQRRKLVVMNKCAISFSGCGETRWHLDALLRKSRRHLAQSSIFAANGRHVGDSDFLEPQDQFLWHGFPPAWAWRQASCRLDRLVLVETISGREVRVIKYGPYARVTQEDPLIRAPWEVLEGFDF